jgi:malonate-semialdehyde dehydrogenase (acetylating) / methylmalonate-semialdehyde dehydrogenase
MISHRLIYAIQVNNNLRTFVTSKKPVTAKLFIDGEFIESRTKEWIEVRNPATQEVVTLVPQATQDELEYAAESSFKAFKAFKNSTILTRQKLMLDYQLLVRENIVRT